MRTEKKKGRRGEGEKGKDLRAMPPLISFSNLPFSLSPFPSFLSSVLELFVELRMTADEWKLSAADEEVADVCARF